MIKQIVIVLILALLASAGGWLLFDNQSQPLPEARSLFVDIDSHVANINEILIENSEGVIVKAKRMASDVDGRSGQRFPIQASELESQRWFVVDAAESQLEFAADQNKLGTLVNALVKAKLIEPKTSLPNKHERLGLRSIEQADSQAIKVSIKSSSKEWQVLIGNEASSGAGFYVRKLKDNQTWLSDQIFDIDEAQSAWLNPLLFAFSVDNIRALRRLGEEQWTMEKTDDSANDFLLVDREDSELKYAEVLNTFAQSIATLSFDGLKSMDEVFWETQEILVELELETFSGDKYQLSLVKGDDEHYLKVTSTVDADFWSQWLFNVSNYTETQLNKSHRDFLVDDDIPVDEVAQ